jgi:hypothetical protein
VKSNFIIWGKLAGWNDLSRVHPIVAHKRKMKDSKRVQWAIKLARLKPFREAVIISVVWVEPDFRRDPDNVSSGGLKVILDALVSMGIIPNDTRRWVKQVNNTFADPNKANPCVVVDLETYKGEKA